MPAPDLPLLLAAAEEAGRIALSYWKAAPETWEKADNAGPVTAADLAVDRMLREELQGARPGYGWLSEETEDRPEARRDHETIFIVDPIDGTRAFIAGEDGFAQALAVSHRGQITAAVVHFPARGETYAASCDGPALRNGVVLQASGRAEPDGARVLCQPQALDPSHWRPGAVPQIARSFRAALAWRLCLVAAGEYDAALSFRRIWEWDLAAGDLIARRAGAQVSDQHGQPIRYNSPAGRAPGLVAAAAPLHGALVERLRQDAGPSPRAQA